MSEVRGGDERGCPMSEVGGSEDRSYPTSEVRGGGILPPVPRYLLRITPSPARTGIR